MFGDIGKMLQNFGEMKAKAAEMEKELSALVVQGESKDGLVKVRVNGKFEVLDVQVADGISGKPAAEIAVHVREAVSKAMSQARKIAQEKARELTGGMSIPGLF